MEKKRIYQAAFLGIFCCLLFAVVLESPKGERSDLQIEKLQINYVENPVGLDDEKPSFSWEIVSGTASVYQKSYQIKVYQVDWISKNRHLVWNSGRKRSADTTGVTYEGKELLDCTHYEWELTVWDSNGHKYKADYKGTFETAFISKQPFENAEFIAVHDEDMEAEGLPVFYQSFSLKKKVAKIFYYGSALGMYDAYINGKRIGTDELKPGWTNYNQRLLYNTYDITDLMNYEAENTIAVMLGNGWCLGKIAHDTYTYDRPWYIGNILVLYEDGTQEEIVTDSSWMYTNNTAILSADIYDGESVDANRITTKEISEKIEEGGEILENSAKKAKTMTQKELLFSSYYGKNVTIQSEYSKRSEEKLPIKIEKGKTLILDMGQNITALPYMEVEAPKGTEIVLEFSEMLNDTGAKERGNDGEVGTLYRKNLRTAEAKIQYITNGTDDKYQSTFSYFGYRYVAITPSEDMVLTDFESRTVSSMGEPAGVIETDNEKLNRLFQNIQWSQRDNWLLIATDCPQRDERLPWIGDLQIFCKTSLYNDELYQFYRKWCQDAIDSQIGGTYPNIVPYNQVTGTGNAGWSDAGIIIPYKLYQHYGEQRFITDMYESMKAYMDWLESRGIQGAYPTYGDWLAYEDTDSQLVAVAYYAQDACYMSEMAEAIGKVEDAAHYAALYEEIREYFQKQYVKGGHLKENSQTAYLLALHMHLLDDAETENVKNDLRENIEKNGYKLSTGFIGTSFLLQTLSENGMGDLAYRLILQEENPSWLYSVNQGATTIWERWDSYTKEEGFNENGMNSFNHFAYGSVGQWMYEYLLGIQYDSTKENYQFVIAPQEIPEEIPTEILSTCKGYYNSPLGKIGVAWMRSEDGMEYELEIPANTFAKVILPTVKLQGKGKITTESKTCDLEELEVEKKLYDLERNESEISFILPAGTYRIK